MRQARARSLRRNSIVLALAVLLAGAAQAAPTLHPLDVGPVASLRNTDLPEVEAAPDPLEPGEFELLPQWDIATGAPVLVMVSLKDQRAYVYREGQPIAVSTVSTGQPGYETPTGIFQILEKKKVHHSNRYEDNRGRPAAMPFMQRLTWDGIALHAGRVMPKPASHGCVRLPREFAEQLFRVTQHGGTVVVSEDGSVDALARAGVDLPLALLIGTSDSVHEIAGTVLADREPAFEDSAGARQGTAFAP